MRLWVCRGKELRILSDDYSSKFNLHPEYNGLYSREWEFPFRKFRTGSGRLNFLHEDSLFANIDFCMVHRVYEDVQERNRFEDEIRIFEIMDHFNPSPEKATLFTGSSTIRKWVTIKDDLPGIELINRGFGGSTMKDLNHYLERIVFPYNPAHIFVYEGDNDIARGVSPEEFIEDCKDFILACKTRIPEAEIHFLSIKPSPARIRNWKEMQRSNRMLNELSGQYEKVHFIDISRSFLNEDESLKNDVFEADRLHLNKEGYEMLANVLRLTIYE